MSARKTVEEVLGVAMTRELWTANYEKVLPVSVQDFDLGAILPAVFYMFRFGSRRGRGQFLATFTDEKEPLSKRRRSATVERIANRLAETDTFKGFEGDTEQAILGDLLLCFCLENRNREPGRRKQVQRAAPAHYMSGWIDLPQEVGHLRLVPEMIVSLLADQEGERVEQTGEKERAWFAVKRGFSHNVLLGAFSQGMTIEGHMGDRRSDKFHEDSKVGLDQLLTIRLAQKLDEPPKSLGGKNAGAISNQRPIAEKATREFSDDLRHFVRGYSGIIPRLVFVDLLESCMALGLTTIATSTMELLSEWAKTGVIRQKVDQKPIALFVDCSNNMDRKLRAIAERSFDDLLRQIERLPIILMALRLLDHSARHNAKIRRLEIPTWPYATEWLNLLGKLLFKQGPGADFIHALLDQKASELEEKLKEDEPVAADILDNDAARNNPVWRMAEALTLLLGRNNAQSNVMSMIDSSMMTGRPNGLAVRRSIQRQLLPGEPRKRRDARSMVLTDSALDYLAHRHLLRAGRRALSFHEFLEILRDRHGLHVDVSPPGLMVSNELLSANRAALERRLRDLGLLVGVNDAESMKRLQPRFERPERDHGVD